MQLKRSKIILFIRIISANAYTMIERKSRVPQIQGVQGRSRSKLLRALGNAEDGVSSQRSLADKHRLSRRVNKMEWFFDNLYFTDAKVVNRLHIA